MVVVQNLSKCWLVFRTFLNWKKKNLEYLVPEKREKASVEKKKDEKVFFGPNLTFLDRLWVWKKATKWKKAWLDLMLIESDRKITATEDSDLVETNSCTTLGRVEFLPHWHFKDSCTFEYETVKSCLLLLLLSQPVLSRLRTSLKHKKTNERFWKPLIENDFSSEAVAAEKLPKMDSGKVVMN